SVEWRL
ncbi:hypothetical protein HKBW3S44_01279, partial [Candidatus Hakubella thermalkaliphila]